MPIASISLFRYRTPTTFHYHHLLRHITISRHLPITVSKQQQQQQQQKNPNNISRKPQQPNKYILKARQTLVKEYSSLSPILSPDTKPNLSDSQAVGTVAAAQANFMRVIIQSLPPSSGTFLKSPEEEDSRIGVELLCVVRAVLKKIRRRVLVGDKVVVGSIDWVDRRGMIENVFQRSTEILDPPVANVDHLLVLFSMDQPKIEPFALTRFLVEAESTGIPLTLALNKSELVDEEMLGSKWFEEQRVGEVSTRSGRGKHTTRNVSLLPLSAGGYLADTPGFNQPSLLKVTKQSLAETFPEIQKMLSSGGPAKCSFNDCLHLGEPGCIVNGDWERYSFYFQLLDEIRIREEFQLRTYGTKKEGDVRYKVGDMGVQQAEPRLEPKKHRRQSRKRINQSLLDELDELDDDDNLLDEENDPILRALKNENQ
ncbi:small ribosomal subunit biogenesis GTPase RsgA 1, mitochondrial isoform X2 [Ricinus communis]|uniref:small ribosomal subunit biogenesis GTPase RsgA 1, mitochondrial isoform X2 n=1 Tax=Ricinus communis TaxID=3988 RepID=UPI00201AFC3D|nr:small ribosomal subunit biogenesis GTPase RsgA 1, mitochondrial isoform X2 [Ricinus communis]